MMGKQAGPEMVWAAMGSRCGVISRQVDRCTRKWGHQVVVWCVVVVREESGGGPRGAPPLLRLKRPRVSLPLQELLVKALEGGLRVAALSRGTVIVKAGGVLAASARRGHGGGRSTGGRCTRKPRRQGHTRRALAPAARQGRAAAPLAAARRRGSVILSVNPGPSLPAGRPRAAGPRHVKSMRLRRATSPYHRALILGVRASVRMSTWCSPNFLLYPSAHSKLSRSDQTK